ncbi:hypothetical protein HY503_01115 [Candidatus Woesebacteria bacterium]|nr:hypothetical protein [Candidatus Woesebacteria bacterium]
MKYVRLLLPIPIIALAVAAFFFWPKAIYIGEVTCRSQFGPCTLLGDKLSGLSGSSLYDTRREVRYYLSSEDSISDFSIQFKIPDTLEVAIIEKKPKFALKDTASGFFALVDKEGKVLKIVEDSSLPRVISADKLPNVGEKVKEEYFFALNIIYNVFASYQARQGRVENNSLVVDIPQGFKVIFPLNGDKDVLLGALRLLIERLNASSKDTRINETGISQIDLRFKNPVLK